MLEIYQSRIGSGTCCGKTAEQMLDTMLARTSGQDDTQYISPLTDGRHIAVSTQRMADGGMVTTHQDITDQRRSEAKIVHMALHDALTDLPNRVLLNERLEHALTRVRRGEMVAVHLLDLDHFKTVNDTLGHPTGDKLLKMVTAAPARPGPGDGHDRAHGRRRVRGPAGGHHAAGGCHRAGAAHHRDRERALRSRRHASRDRHQRRHRRRPGRRARAPTS